MEGRQGLGAYEITVRDEPAEAAISSARLALVDATRQVLANLLGLLGVSAPESL